MMDTPQKRTRDEFDEMPEGSEDWKRFKLSEPPPDPRPDKRPLDEAADGPAQAPKRQRPEPSRSDWNDSADDMNIDQDPRSKRPFWMVRSDDDTEQEVKRKRLLMQMARERPNLVHLIERNESNRSAKRIRV